MYYIFFIHLSISRYFSSFCILAIVNDAAMYIEVQNFFKLMFWFSLDKYSEVELLDHMVALFLIFLRKPHTVFYSGKFCTNLHTHQ